MAKQLRILVPTGMLGYGFSIEEFEKGLEKKPDAICADSGSTDSGPQKLALGSMTCPEEAYEKELEILIKGGQKNGIPVMISSAGGDGTNRHVDLFMEMIRRIARKNGFRLKVAVIYSEIDKNLIKQKIDEGKVKPCGPVEPLAKEEVDKASVVVAQIGAEPFLKVFREHPDFDIILSGRAYDPVPTAAMGIQNGFDPGLSWHMGKIMECGALCAEPSGRVIFGTLTEDSFVLEPLNPKSRCTTYSVAAHTLYEKSHPYLLPGPGGVLDLSQTKFEQMTDRTVKVSGSKFHPSHPYTVKLEGAKTLGYRSIAIAGIRDPILISQIDAFLENVRKFAEEIMGERMRNCKLIFHVYGKNGVMGRLEPEKGFTPIELCVIIEAVADDQKTATFLCNKARVAMLHDPYEGRMATSGNVGFPFTPLEIDLGHVCAFNVYHLMELDRPAELFPIKYVEVS